MMIRHIEGAQHVIGQSQGFLGLPVRWVEEETLIQGVVHTATHMKTAWEPTPEELTRIQAGHSIIVSIMGLQHPPIYLSVAEEKHEGEALDEINQAFEVALESLESLKTLYGTRMMDMLGKVSDRPEEHGDSLQFNYNRVCNALKELERVRR